MHNEPRCTKYVYFARRTRKEPIIGAHDFASAVNFMVVVTVPDTIGTARPRLLTKVDTTTCDGRSNGIMEADGDELWTAEWKMETNFRFVGAVGRRCGQNCSFSCDRLRMRC